jgi:hypothetical protein
MHKTVNGKQITILIHVDDLLVLAKTVDLLHLVRDILLEEFEKIEWKIANEFTYLGMLLQKETNGFVLSMQYYIEQTLDFYTDGNADRLKTYVTPAKSDLYAEEGELVTTKAEMEKFHTTVAKLLYLGKRTRPGVLLAVQYLCTRVKNRTTGDFRKLERVLGFLKLTKKRKRFIDNSVFDRVKLYIDAAFGCHSDGKGQAGCCKMLGKTLVNEITRKLKMVTKDSTDSELVALSDHVQEAMVMTEFLEAQGMKLKIPVIYQDNASTITLVTQGGGKPRTKYLRVRRELVKELVDKKLIEIVFIGTKWMIADVLTKPLQGDDYHKFSLILLGYDVKGFQWMK